MRIEAMSHSQLKDLIDRLYFHPSTITAEEKRALSKHLENTLIAKDESVKNGEGI